MSVSFKEILYLIIVACLALALNYYAISIGQQTYWILLASLLFSLLLLQDNFKFHYYIILITGFLAALLTAMQMHYLATLPHLAIYLGIVTLVSMFIGQRFPEWFLPALIINVCVLLSALYPAVDEKIYVGSYFFSDNAARAIYIINGALVAWVSQALLWASVFRRTNKIIYDEFCGRIVATLNLMCRLNNAIFACFLEPAYQENTYLFERRIHVLKNKIIESIVELRNLSQTKTISHKVEFINVVNHLHLMLDLILQYAQLRRRVTDNTIFAVCFNELAAIQDEIERLLSDMMVTFPDKKYHLLTDGLLETIKRFEEVYQNVLQVTSREPLVFMLFIASLQEMCNELATFYSALLAIRSNDDERK